MCLGDSTSLKMPLLKCLKFVGREVFSSQQLKSVGLAMCVKQFVLILNVLTDKCINVEDERLSWGNSSFR